MKPGMKLGKESLFAPTPPADARGCLRLALVGFPKTVAPHSGTKSAVPHEHRMA